MLNVQMYEKIIKCNSKSSKIKMILLYCGVTFLGMLLFLLSGFNPYSLVLTAIISPTLIITTWKYTNVEFEYSFTSGSFTFSKIYGQSQRRVIFESDIKNFDSIIPFSRESIPQNASVIDASETESEQDLCICILEQDRGKKVYIILEYDAQTVAIFKFFNPSAIDRALISKYR